MLLLRLSHKWHLCQSWRSKSDIGNFGNIECWMLLLRLSYKRHLCCNGNLSQIGSNQIVFLCRWTFYEEESMECCTADCPSLWCPLTSDIFSGCPSETWRDRQRWSRWRGWCWCWRPRASRTKHLLQLSSVFVTSQTPSERGAPYSLQVMAKLDKSSQENTIHHFLLNYH